MAKYTFVKPYSISQCQEFNQVGLCLKSKTTSFVKGDTIDGMETMDGSSTIVSVINGINWPIPQEYVIVRRTEGYAIPIGQPGEIKNDTDILTGVLPKIGILIVIIIVIVGLLKLFKVF